MRFSSWLAVTGAISGLFFTLIAGASRAGGAGGVYDAADLVRAARMVEGLIPADPEFGDLDGDGEVTLDDLDLMRRRVHGLEWPVRLHQETIGSTGGFVGNDQSMELVVPDGAFDRDMTLTIDRLPSGEAPLSGVDNGPLYQVSGVPDGVDASLTVRIPVPDTFDSQDLVLEVGELTFGSRGFGWYYYLVDADLEDGALVWNMPPIPSLDGWMPSVAGQTMSGETDRSAAASLLEAEADEGYRWRFRLVGGGEHSHSEEAQLINDRFRIRFPVSMFRPSATVRSNAVHILKGLDDTYNMLTDAPASFDFSRRTRWPIDVYLKNLGEADGNMVSSRLRVNWDYIELNINLLQDLGKARTTAGHELFHIVQGLYDSTPMNLWLDEATATWLEGQMVTNTAQYVPSYYQSNPRVALRGMHVEPHIEWKFSFNPRNVRTWNTKIAGDHGYGMSVFIEYLSQQDGWDLGRLRLLYEQIRTGAHPVEAVLGLVSGDARAAWADFTRQMLSNQLYPLSEQESATKYSMDLGRAFNLRDEGRYGWDSDPRRIVLPEGFVNMRELAMQVQQLGARSLHYFVRMFDPADFPVFPDTMRMIGEVHTEDLDDLAHLRLMAVLYQQGHDPVVLPFDDVDWLMHRSTHRIEVSFPRPSSSFRYLLAVFNDNIELPYDTRIPVTLRSFIGAYQAPEFIAGMIPLTDAPVAEVKVRDIILEGDLGSVSIDSARVERILPGARDARIRLPHDHVDSIRAKINAELHEPLTREVMFGVNRRFRWTVTVSEMAAPWRVERRQWVDGELQFTELVSDVSAAHAWSHGFDLPAPAPDGVVSYNFAYRFHSSLIIEDTSDQRPWPTYHWQTDSWQLLPIRIEIQGVRYQGGQP